jgi:hypothetical protein
MKKKLLAANHSLLFLCVSMYLGTGWSLVLFSFPIAQQLTVENYYLQFVPQVAAATKFFTYMTALMIGLCVIMAIAEWRTGFLWVPLVVLAAVIGATGLTMIFIFPLNEAMSKGITDPGKLKDILSQWMFLNKIRVGFWTIQWISLMVYFASHYLRAEDRV